MTCFVTPFKRESNYFCSVSPFSRNSPPEVCSAQFLVAIHDPVGGMGTIGSEGAAVMMIGEVIAAARSILSAASRSRDESVAELEPQHRGPPHHSLSLHQPIRSLASLPDEYA
jgi:hypothetical protein